ncbi:MAG: hypothetical protein AABX55_00100 [Nanoarchaeota archaeon]
MARQIFIKNNKILDIKNLQPLEEEIIFNETKFLKTHNLSLLREELEKKYKGMYFNIVDYDQYYAEFDSNIPVYIVRVNFYSFKK